MTFAAKACDSLKDCSSSRRKTPTTSNYTRDRPGNPLWHQMATGTQSASTSSVEQDEETTSNNVDDEKEEQTTSDMDKTGTQDNENSSPATPLKSCPPAPTPKTSGVKAIVKPEHDFSGRSYSDIGVGEKINLSFEAPQSNHLPKHKQAEFHGGLQWFKTSGKGALLNGVNPYDGNASFSANEDAGNVSFELRVAAQGCKGAVVATKTVRIVLPNKNSYMVHVAGTDIWHCKGYWSVGFCGWTYIRPDNVSFGNVEFQEGATAAVASGFLKLKNGDLHPAGSCSKSEKKSKDDWCPVEPPVFSGTGSWPVASDNVKAGKEGPNIDGSSNKISWGKGEFTWDIPWRIRWGKGYEYEFMKAKHFMTSDENGTATIEKEGPKFSRALNDPSDANCPARLGPCASK